MQMHKLSIKKILIFMWITIRLITVYPIVTVLLILWYKFVCLLAKIVKKFEGPVCGISTFFTPDKLFEKPNATLIHIAVLDGIPDINRITKDILGMYESRNEDNSRMYDKLGFTIVHWMGYVFWKKARSFEIESRIHFLHDPSVNLENIGVFVESIVRQPFKPDEPLWEIFVISNNADVNANGPSNSRTFVVFRTHHLLLDGMSLVKLWYKADGELEPPQDIAKCKTSAVKQNNEDNGRIRNFFRNWKQSWHEHKLYWMTPYMADKTLSCPNDYNCITKSYKDFSKDWFCSGVNKVNMDAYRDSLRKMEFTITHAVITGYTRGFRRFIETHYGFDAVPRRVHILGSIPLADHPHNVLTNHWSIMRYKADLHTETILEELEAAKAEYSRAVNDLVPRAFSCLVDLARSLPGQTFEGMMETRNSGTLSLSNIPGPTMMQKMFGLDVLDRMIWCPLSRNNSGIALLFLTYNGSGNFAITADSEVIRNRRLFDDLNRFVKQEIQVVLDEVSRLVEIKTTTAQPEDLIEITVL